MHRLSGSGIWETLSGFIQNTVGNQRKETFTAREIDYPKVVVINIHIRLPQIHMKIWGSGSSKIWRSRRRNQPTKNFTQKKIWRKIWLRKKHLTKNLIEKKTLDEKFDREKKYLTKNLIEKKIWRKIWSRRKSIDEEFDRRENNIWRKI